MIKRGLFSLALVAAVAVPMQAQAQVAGTYTVSGSSGSWFLDFTFQNLSPVVATGNQQMLYYMGVTNLAGGAYAGGPTGYSQYSGLQWLVDDRHLNNDANFYLYGIGAGSSMGGFLATSTAAQLPDQLNIFGYTYNGDSNPAYNGVATRAQVSVPEPGSMMLLATGLFGLVGLRRRKEDLA